MENMILSGKSCINVKSSFVSVWVRCAVTSANSITNFLVSCFNGRSAIGRKSGDILEYSAHVPYNRISGKRGFKFNKMPAILALRVMLWLIRFFQLYASPIDKTILANAIV